MGLGSACRRVRASRGQREGTARGKRKARQERGSEFKEERDFQEGVNCWGEAGLRMVGKPWDWEGEGWP